MNYQDKDLDGKLQEDLEILDRLRSEGQKIIEPKQTSYQELPTCIQKNKVGVGNKKLISILKEKIQQLKESFTVEDDLGIHDYDTTPEEEKKIDSIVRLENEGQKLVKKYTIKRDGSFEILLIISVASVSLGIILGLLLIK